MSPAPCASRAIDYFNKRHPLMALQGRISLGMRQAMLDTLPLSPRMRVLEVGATPDMDLVDSNYFSLRARQIGCDVTVTSPEDCSDMAARSGLHWMPFETFLNAQDTFDMVISSAVIEHVGTTPKNKVEHLRQLNVVSKRWIFLTTPNRYHWLEFHTKLPLLHWLPRTIHRGILRAFGLNSWADPDHLDLLSRQEFENLLREVFPKDSVRYRHFRFFGAVSNLTALVDKARR